MSFSLYIPRGHKEGGDGGDVVNGAAVGVDPVAVCPKGSGVVPAFITSDTLDEMVSNSCPIFCLISLKKGTNGFHRGPWNAGIFGI